MFAFRDWWIERIASEGLTANSANKDIIHLGDVLKNVNRRKRLGLVLPLSDMTIRGGDACQRPSFSVQWIRDKLLAPDALKGLNGQARGILLGMINTGYRPSEGMSLTAERIRLDGEVPHISIEPGQRQLKSRNARRAIPLTGVSLDAFREFPEGFARYTDSAGLSATINKFMTENGMRETPSHSLYSLRHSFEDRLLAAEIDERIRRDLMGHALGRVRYGAGGSLAHVQQLLQRIAL
jgi:integrase